MGLVGRVQVRLALGIGLCLALVFALGTVAPNWAPVAVAQEEGAGEPAPDAAPAASDKSLFKHMIESLGWFYTPLYLIISIFMVAMIVLLSMDLRMGVAIPPAFVEEFTDTVNKRRFKEAFDLARNDNSFVARVMTAGMARLQYGVEDARDAAFNMVDSIKAGKEQVIAYLATIGTLGPLLGLVGTVFGMILAFKGLSDGRNVSSSKLAEAISHALVVTLFGVALAVPAIFCHSMFKSRLVRIAMDTGNIADDLLTQMYHNSKRPGSGPVSNAAPGPAAAVRPG